MNATCNLVSASFGRRLLVHRRLRLWGPVWILALVAALGGTAAWYAALINQRQALARLEAKSEPMRRIESETLRLQQQLDEFSSSESLVTQLERWDHPAQLVGIVGLAAHSETPDTHIRELSLAPLPMRAILPSQPATGQGTSNARPVEAMQLRLVGLGVDDLAVARFVLALRTSGRFDRVMLKSSSNTTATGIDAREFLVECEYE